VATVLGIELTGDKSRFHSLTCKKAKKRRTPITHQTRLCSGINRKLNRSILLPVSREDSSFGDWMVELVNTIHEVFPGQSKTVTFTIPFLER